MAHKLRAVHVATLIAVVIFCTVAVIPGAGAQQRFTLTKSTNPSDGAVNVGEKVTITLRIENDWDQPATVRVTDPNPDESALKIDSGSITGGATYVPASGGARERVEWTGELLTGGTKTISFKMEALSGGAGQVVTNRADLEDVNNPQTVPDARDSANIVIKLRPPVLEPIDNDDEDGDYTLKWSTLTGASTYFLEGADNAAFDDSDPVYGGSETQHVVTGQAPGKWYYRVRAVSGPMASDWSNTEWTIVVPPPPVLYPIDNPCNRPDYLVDWSDVASAASYTLQEDTEQDFPNPTTHKDISESSYQVTDQPEGTWYYRVRAEGPSNSDPSDWSERQLVKVGGSLACDAHLPIMLRRWPPLPETPALHKIENTDGAGDYVVRWSSAAGALTYILQEAKSNTFQPVEDSYESTTTSYGVQDRGASRLFYRVKARNATGDSSWSNVEHVDVVWHLEGMGPNPESVERQTNGSVVAGLTYFGTFPNAQDVSDYFYFDLPTGQSIEMWLENIPGGHNWDLALRDRSLSTYDGWYSVRSSNQDEHVEVTVPAGQYYIQVYNKSGPGSTQPYRLKVIY